MVLVFLFSYKLPLMLYQAAKFLSIYRCLPYWPLDMHAFLRCNYLCMIELTFLKIRVVLKQFLKACQWCVFLSGLLSWQDVNGPCPTEKSTPPETHGLLLTDRDDDSWFLMGLAPHF